MLKQSTVKPKKILIIYFLLFIIGFLGVLGYYFLQKSIQTKNGSQPDGLSQEPLKWNTFNSVTNHYSVNYPLDWNTLLSYDNDNSKECFKIGDLETEQLDQLTSLEPKIIKTHNCYQICYYPNNKVENSNKKTMINNYEAIITKTSSAYESNQEVVTLINPYHDSYIQFTKLIGESKLFNNVISTLTFIDSSATAQTKDWVTYQNTQYGFLFKYPNDYILEDKMLKILAENELNYSGLTIINNFYQNKSQYPAIYLSIISTPKTPEEFLDFDYQRELDLWENQGLKNNPKIKKPQVVSNSSVHSKNILALKIERQRISNGSNLQQLQYLFKKDNLLYNLYANYGVLDSETGFDGNIEKNALNDIFSSFKFTK